MNRSSGAGKPHKNEPPVEQYRKEIGKHQEVIENPNSVKKRMEHKEKVRGENQTEKPQDLQTGIQKTLYMVVLWAILIGGVYFFIQQIMKPAEHPFVGDGK